MTVAPMILTESSSAPASAIRQTVCRAPPVYGCYEHLNEIANRNDRDQIADDELTGRKPYRSNIRMP
jgi:hypothetical protein